MLMTSSNLVGRITGRISGLLAFQNPTGKDSSLTIRCSERWPIAHQTTGSGEFSKLERRGNRITSREGSDLINVVGK
jgi:hypothetical protein